MQTMPPALYDHPSPADALAWLVEMGADEVILEQPIDRFADSAKATEARKIAAPAPPRPVSAPPPTPKVALASPPSSPEACTSIEELRKLLNFFEAHPLRKSAMNLCFHEGSERADVLVIGDRPYAEEDKSGQVFALNSRLMLTNMLTAIGLKFEDVALMNLVPWRPAGGAEPKLADIQALVPFARRAIEIMQPKFILAFSAMPGHYLAGGDPSLQRQRGKWLELGSAALLSTFHPEELHRLPSLKREAWKDLQTFRERLS